MNVVRLALPFLLAASALAASSGTAESRIRRSLADSPLAGRVALRGAWQVSG